MKNQNSSGGNSDNEAASSSSSSTLWDIHRIALLFSLGVAVSCLLLYLSAHPFRFLPSSLPIANETISSGNVHVELERVLKGAAMENKTVILTTVNEAWTKAESLLDLFLESFKIGNNTNRLRSHLVIVSLDQKAHARCLALHPHCYMLRTQKGPNFSAEAYFMTPNYLEMMWRRIDFLATVLKMGYNFVFTDADIMWLQDPFPHFHPDGDFQIACDHYLGNPYNRDNQPNGGFNYVKSNPRTIQFYTFWHKSRKTYPGLHDQDVLNKIKYHPFIKKIGLQIRFLDTAYFGGFCEPSRDFNLACTMHANCCFGLESKLHDLKRVLEDWRRFMSTPPNLRASSSFAWRAPQKCRTSSLHPPKLPKSIKGGN